MSNDAENSTGMAIDGAISLIGVVPDFEATTHGKKRKLFANGFAYLTEKEHKDKTYWKCARYVFVVLLLFHVITICCRKALAVHSSEISCKFDD